MTIRVGVFGAAGRMGRTVCEAVMGDPELELVAAIDPQHDGLDLRPVTGVDADLRILGSPDGMAAAGVEVAVDGGRGRTHERAVVRGERRARGDRHVGADRRRRR